MFETIKRKLSQVEGLVKMTSSNDVVGDLRISLVYPSKTVEVLAKKNLVVTGGKLRLLQALYMGVSAQPLDTLRVGSGGTIDPAGRFPKTVSVTQESLFSEVQRVPLTYSIDETYPSITYLADIDPELCNNTLISEAGLFFGDDVMFNIKTFPGIPKTSDFSIHFEWTIRVN